MGNRIQCFLLTQTERQREYLRRYKSSGDIVGECPVHGYHTAMNFLRDIPAEKESSGFYNGEGEMQPKEHPLWPITCECGYRFEDTDKWQVFRKLVFRRSDTGEETTIDEAPAGAMFMADWLAGTEIGSDFWKARGKGPHLMVKTPGGQWDVDSVATNGPGWTREGEPPNVTANPSILCNSYHGWLRNGVLEEC